ncbi:MAG: hypothetical protein EPO16_10625 [Dehalococcoidia bacterium]|nr:MAG: hypothetical protein EPO16_10625 [Dehalococcoidia bacterium]
MAVVGALIQVAAFWGTVRSTWPGNFAVAGLGLVIVLVPAAALIVSSGLVFVPSALAWVAAWVWIWRSDGNSTADETAWPGLVVVVGGFGLGLILLNNV